MKRFIMCCKQGPLCSLYGRAGGGTEGGWPLGDSPVRYPPLLPTLFWCGRNRGESSRAGGKAVLTQSLENQAVGIERWQVWENTSENDHTKKFFLKYVILSNNMMT